MEQMYYLYNWLSISTYATTKYIRMWVYYQTPGYCNNLGKTGGDSLCKLEGFWICMIP